MADSKEGRKEGRKEGSPWTKEGRNRSIWNGMDGRTDGWKQLEWKLVASGKMEWKEGMLAILREREVAGVGSDMALSKGLLFRAATDGESVSGKFT